MLSAQQQMVRTGKQRPKAQHQRSLKEQPLPVPLKSQQTGALAQNTADSRRARKKQQNTTAVTAAKQQRLASQASIGMTGLLMWLLTQAKARTAESQTTKVGTPATKPCAALSQGVNSPKLPICIMESDVLATSL